jgi:hypothetical protein
MYYSHQCSYCSKVFYTYNDNKWNAAADLYKAIKQHLIDYDEDHKEHEFDDGPYQDTKDVYAEMSESNQPPSGGYEVQ